MEMNQKVSSHIVGNYPTAECTANTGTNYEYNGCNAREPTPIYTDQVISQHALLSSRRMPVIAAFG